MTALCARVLRLLRDLCGGEPAAPDPQDPPDPQDSLSHRILALDAVGWHVIGLRPCKTGHEPALWRVTIARYDESASMTLVDADPAAALADLVRYVRADAA